MTGKMLRQAIEFICGIAQENLVSRGVDSLSGKDNSDSDLENMESSFSSLMARADDVEKEISIKVEQGCRKRKREVEVWFEDVKKVEGDYCTFVEEEERKGFMKKLFGGDKAIKLKARICYLDKQSRHFGELVVADDKNAGLPRLTTELEGAVFQDNFRRIWNLLENNRVSSIGVHGMGGVGKSALVEHIHNQLLERNKCVLWVVVSSQRCSIKMFQDKIARKLGMHLSDEDDDEGARAGRLNHALSRRKNVILILDDVWEPIDLAKVGVPLSMRGCKWMITSRSLNVCREMNCQKMISVKPLVKDEGWKLFLRNIGHDAKSTLSDPGVEGIAKRMVKICDGLPLGIITLAGAVSGVTEIQEWRHELRTLEESAVGNEWMEEKVFRVLKYSFDRLNPNDQHCFLYCSLYPEDYNISREKLYGNLISEKLVDEKKSRAAQRDEAHSIVNRLVKVSLLESVYDNWVKMHDLVRSMAHKITKGKTMVIAGEKSRKEIPIADEWTKDLEKVSLMMNGINEIPTGISPDCPKLSTLLLQDIPLKQIATSFFTQMCGLRTLDLSRTDIEELPVSVSDLVNLTSLLLGWCRKLRHVPCVRKLKVLREFDLSMTSIEHVPRGMEELRFRLLRLPPHIQAELVEGGETLEVFEGGLKNVNDFNRLIARKCDSVSYSVVVGDYNVDVDDWENAGDRRELYVCAYDLKGQKENESSFILAEYIQYLEFDSCNGMSKCLLNDLTNPASLNKLKISNCREIECILTLNQCKAKAAQDSKARFQALEDMQLHNLDEFTGVIQKLEIEDGPPPLSVFSSLRKLIISHCNKMKKLGLPLFAFEKLEYVSICVCEEIEEIIEVGASADADARLVCLPNLTYLNLYWLPSLESFCRAQVICNLLEYFRVDKCPRLEVPFLNWGTPDSYEPLFSGDGVEQIKR